MLRRSFAWSGGPRHWDPWPRQKMQSADCRAIREFPITKGFSDWYLLTGSQVIKPITNLESTWSLEGTKPSVTTFAHFWTVDCSSVIWYNTWLTAFAQTSSNIYPCSSATEAAALSFTGGITGDACSAFKLIWKLEIDFETLPGDHVMLFAILTSEGLRV